MENVKYLLGYGVYLFNKTIATGIAIFVLTIPIVGDVAAVDLFGGPSYRISFDEDILERTQVFFTNDSYIPDKLYYRLVFNEDETEMALEYFLYYTDQTYYLAPHEHDWEFVIVYFRLADEEMRVYGVVYDEWHYVIGRETNPTTSFRITENNESGTHVGILIDNEYHAPQPDDRIYFGEALDNYLNHGIETVRITDEVLTSADVDIGFDRDIFDDPFSLWDKNIFGNYARYSAWKDITYAIAVAIDGRFDYFDFTRPSLTGSLFG